MTEKVRSLRTLQRLSWVEIATVKSWRGLMCSVRSWTLPKDMYVFMFPVRNCVSLFSHSQVL